MTGTSDGLGVGVSGMTGTSEGLGVGVGGHSPLSFFEGSIGLGAGGTISPPSGTGGRG
jgi:hypothetical protein